jgi:DNA-directed RNA polymerase specialized sigma subunit
MSEMTIQEKKEYLRMYIPIMSQIEMMEMRRQKMYNISGQKLSLTSSSRGVVGDRLAESLCDVISMEEEFFEKDIKEYIKTISTILTAINALKDIIEKQILTLRYIDGMKWVEIYIKMGYKERQVHQHHSRALKNIEIKEDIEELYLNESKEG